jgi:hypothetical protein
VRTLAIKLLGQIGKPAVPTMKELLKNADTLDTIALVQAIATLGSEARPFLSELQAIMIKNRFWDAEEDLIGTFKKCGAEGAKGLANVLETLQDPHSPYFAPDDDRSKTLLKTLGEMGADAKSAVPSLMELLRERESLRLQILDVLGVSGKRAVPRFKEVLKNADTLDKITLIQAVATLGPDARPFLSELQAIMIKDRFWDAQEELVSAFKKCGPEGADGLANVLRTLHDPKSPYFAPDDDRSKTLLKALGEIGPQAKSAVPVLMELLRESDSLSPQIVKALDGIIKSDPGMAIETLEKIGPSESLPILAKLANKESPPTLRAPAIKLLVRMGKAAVPTFNELLKNADTLDTIALIKAIAMLQSDAKPLLTDLQRIMTRSRFWDAQDELISTFKKCGPEGADGLADVLRTLHDPKSPYFAPDDDRTKTLLKAIGEMGAQAKSAVPVLIDLLREGDSLRPQILDALGGVGPAAKEAIPVVEALLKDAALAEQARIALRRMGKIVTIDKK